MNFNFTIVQDSYSFDEYNIFFYGNLRILVVNLDKENL